jgi:hypothetical protein
VLRVGGWLPRTGNLGGTFFGNPRLTLGCNADDDDEYMNVSQGSSVSILSDCRLNDWDSVPDGGNNFSSSLCVLASQLLGPPSSHPVGTKGP